MKVADAVEAFWIAIMSRRDYEVETDLGVRLDAGDVAE